MTIKNPKNAHIVIVVSYMGIFHELPPSTHAADCIMQVRVILSNGMLGGFRLRSDVSHFLIKILCR